MTNKLNVVSPKNDIYVIDPKNINKKITTYYLNKHGFFKIKYYIQNSYNETIFKSTYSTSCNYGKLKNPKNDEVLYIFNNITHFLRPNELIISSFKNGRETVNDICKVRDNSIFTSLNYEIIFFNKATEKKELLQIEYSKKYCRIYHGGVMICKFNFSYSFTEDSKIEIAPNVDTLFILIIVIDIYRLVQRKMAAATAA